jgi:ribonuclease HII
MQSTADGRVGRMPHETEPSSVAVAAASILASTAREEWLDDESRKLKVDINALGEKSATISQRERNREGRLHPQVRN